MKRIPWCLVLVLFSVTAFAGSPRPFDWPQWQGPDRNAISKETGLLKEWSEGGPPLAWRIEGIGGGYSGPSIAAGRIFGMSNRGNDEVVWALSEVDGSTLWTTPLGQAVTEGLPQGKEGPGCTPTVDGCLYGANGGNGGGYLVCLDFQTGEVLWNEREAPKGSVAVADGRLYYRTEKGTMLLIEPNRDQYVECGRFEQPDRSVSPAWTHPVVANGKLYVRDQDLLLCYDVKAKE